MFSYFVELWELSLNVSCAKNKMCYVYSYQMAINWNFCFYLLFFSCRNENQQFKRIVEKLERSPVCQRLPFRSFLVLPFQRITRIKLLVQVCVCCCCVGSSIALLCVCVVVLAQALLYCLTLRSLSLFNTLHSVSVQNIVKRTAPGTPEATQAIKALKLLEKVQEPPVCLFFSLHIKWW